jgi:hypothetical protein
MANTTLTFNETTYEFVFQKGLYTEDEYRERHQILINGVDTNKFLLVSTEMIDGIVDTNPYRQKYEVLVPTETARTYTTPFKQYYTAGLPFEIMASIVTFLNKSIEKESIENEMDENNKKFQALFAEELKNN